jgi:hypothetical protein
MLLAYWAQAKGLPFVSIVPAHYWWSGLTFVVGLCMVWWRNKENKPQEQKEINHAEK